AEVRAVDASAAALAFREEHPHVLTSVTTEVGEDHPNGSIFDGASVGGNDELVQGVCRNVVGDDLPASGHAAGSGAASASAPGRGGRSRRLDGESASRGPATQVTAPARPLRRARYERTRTSAELRSGGRTATTPASAAPEGAPARDELPRGARAPRPDPRVVPT